MNFKSIYYKDNTFAVAGASNDPEKFGYRVYHMLKKEGVTVYPINPNRSEVQGDKAYPDITSLPKVPDVLSIITPPSISLQIVKEAINAGIKNIWLQPGAEDQLIIEELEKHSDINGIYDKCILTENRFPS